MLLCSRPCRSRNKCRGGLHRLHCSFGLVVFRLTWWARSDGEGDAWRRSPTAKSWAPIASRPKLVNREILHGENAAGKRAAPPPGSRTAPDHDFGRLAAEALLSKSGSHRRVHPGRAHHQGRRNEDSIAHGILVRFPATLRDDREPEAAGQEQNANSWSAGTPFPPPRGMAEGHH